MAGSEDLSSKLLKLALEQSCSDAGMVLLYRQGLFWIVLIACEDHQDDRRWIQVDRSNLHLDLQCPLGNYNLQKCTLLPLSVLCEVTLQGQALDWPKVEVESMPLFWRSGDPHTFPPDGQAVLHKMINFDSDPHLRWLRGRSLCCIPVWDETTQGLQGLLYLEGEVRQAINPFAQDNLTLLGRELIYALQLEEHHRTLMALEPLPPQPFSSPTPTAEDLNQALQQQVRERTQALLQANQELSLEVELHQRITGVAKRFIETDFDRIDEEIYFGLEDLGHFCQVEAAFVCQFSEDTTDFSMTHEWCLNLSDRHLHRMQHLKRRKFPWSMVHLLQGETLAIHNLEDLPETATIDRLHWDHLDIQAILCVPLRLQGRTTGWLGIAHFNNSRQWSATDQRFLESLGDIFNYALHRQAVEQQLREKADQLALTLEATQIGVWEMILKPDLENTHLQGSPQWEKLLGFEPGEFTGGFWNFWP